MYSSKGLEKKTPKKKKQQTLSEEPPEHLDEKTLAQLGAPFESPDLGFVWESGSGNLTSGRVSAYVYSTVLWDRLDDVLGPDGYEEDYEVISNAPLRLGDAPSGYANRGDAPGCGRGHPLSCCPSGTVTLFLLGIVSRWRISLTVAPVSQPTARRTGSW